MNPYIFAVLFFSFSTLTLGWMIWLKRKDTVGIIYFWFSFFVSCWSGGFAVMVSKGISYDNALLASRILNTLAAYIGPCWFHFSLRYTNDQTRLKKFISIFFYIWASFIILLFPNPLYVASVRHLYPLEYYTVIGPLYHFFTALFSLSVCAAFFQLLKHSRTLPKKQRRSINLLILATLIGFLAGGATFLPVYGIDLPPYNLFFLPLYPFIMAYAMSTQKLFDIEELAEAAHRNKLETIGILSASINHELRNPLYIMKNYAESLLINSKEGVYKDFQSLQNKLHETLERIIRQSEKTMKIVGRLTAFARKKPDQDFKMVQVSLKDLVADLDILIRCEIETYKIEIVQEIPENLPPVFADPAHLEEILLNLILNAYQVLKNYKNESESKKQITIKASSFPVIPAHEPGSSSGFRVNARNDIKVDKIQIIIKDNGPGISPDDLPNIFKPFYTKKKEGLGLGLYITKQLVEKNQGTIKIESKPGQGAAFILEFNQA